MHALEFTKSLNELKRKREDREGRGDKKRKTRRQ
jgi:hypothetical protein